MNSQPVSCRLLAAALLCCALFGAMATGVDASVPALPGEESPAQTSDPIDQAEIARRITALAAERAALALQLEQAGEDQHMAAVAERLEQIGLQLKAQADLAEFLTLQTGEPETAAPPDEPSISQLNSLYDQLAAADSALREKRNTLEAARQQLQDLEERARRAKTKLQEATDKNRASRERKAQLAELLARSLREQVNLAALEVRAAQQKATRKGSLEERIAALRTALANDEADAASTLAPLFERESALLREKNRAERQLATAELRLTAAKQRYAQSPQGSADMLTMVEALTAYRDITARQIALASSELERLVALEDTWRNWDSLLRGAYTPEELNTWATEAAVQIGELKRATAMRQSQVADLQIRLEGLDASLNRVPAESQLRPVLEEIRESINRLNIDLAASERLIAADQRLTRRFLDDTRELSGHAGLMQYAGSALESLRAFWSYEITTIDDAPFTVGSLTLGLLLFLAGLWFSRMGAHAIGRLAEVRLKLDAGAAHAMQTFSFYALLAGFTLLALRAVHFPLTAFAFLGGALAIGIGFGSQNVMNNFISGLILMLERPVRAKDIVEVDGSHGEIQRIGPRSTQIRSSDGRHIVVPNSFFLESNVVNWTLSDELIRAKVTVGVAYGSPTRLVRQLIEEVVRDEPLALKKPAPIVIFESFGDNSLNFDVHFWVKSRAPMGVQIVQSKIRFGIDDAFREHDLVIAFPQRDVHLDSLKPIEVRMVGAADGSAEDTDTPEGKS
ncbi:MAG: mechanosensitive ion channel [Pseudomonadales bacterium]|nr:mechanosensitive ion channel [Halioglobus sp.]MCP5128111.1 mechanosensitive ion channel [Pseudomonadales bacterium]